MLCELRVVVILRKAMTHEELERGMLFNSLANIGEFIKLKIYTDPVKLEQDLEQFKDSWCPYNVKKDSQN